MNRPLAIRLVPLLVLCFGCGDDAVPLPDASDASADMSATPAHCAGELVISAVDPGTSVTLFNPSDVPIDLTGTGWVICQRPNYVQLEMIETGVSIAPGGTHTYALPGSFVDQGDDSGELVLYERSAFTDPDSQVDYICWGDGRTENRRSVAEMAGTWSGNCAPPITGAELRRIPGSDGRSASSYDPTGVAAALACP